MSSDKTFLDETIPPSWFSTFNNYSFDDEGGEPLDNSIQSSSIVSWKEFQQFDRNIHDLQIESSTTKPSLLYSNLGFQQYERTLFAPEQVQLEPSMLDFTIDALNEIPLQFPQNTNEKRPTTERDIIEDRFHEITIPSVSSDNFDTAHYRCFDESNSSHQDKVVEQDRECLYPRVSFTMSTAKRIDTSSNPSAHISFARLTKLPRNYDPIADEGTLLKSCMRQITASELALYMPFQRVEEIEILTMPKKRFIPNFVQLILIQ